MSRSVRRADANGAIVRSSSTWRPKKPFGKKQHDSNATNPSTLFSGDAGPPEMGGKWPYRKWIPAMFVALTPSSSGPIVDGTGNITRPSVGSVSVRNMSVSDCKTALYDQLAKGFLRDPLVSVRLAEPRPIYKLGNVRAPGSYPFRCGSTAKSVVALAGGVGLLESNETTPMFEFPPADERLRQMMFQRRSLLIRQARFEAQRDGKDTFEVPHQLEPEEGSGVPSLMEAEKAMMDSQAAIMKSQRDLLTTSLEFGDVVGIRKMNPDRAFQMRTAAR